MPCAGWLVTASAVFVPFLLGIAEGMNVVPPSVKKRSKGVGFFRHLFGEVLGFSGVVVEIIEFDVSGLEPL